jgi:hypothetical protein
MDAPKIMAVHRLLHLTKPLALDEQVIMPTMNTQVVQIWAVSRDQIG